MGFRRKGERPFNVINIHGIYVIVLMETRHSRQDTWIALFIKVTLQSAYIEILAHIQWLKDQIMRTRREREKKTKEKDKQTGMYHMSDD